MFYLTIILKFTLLALSNAQTEVNTNLKNEYFPSLEPPFSSLEPPFSSLDFVKNTDVALNLGTPRNFPQEPLEVKSHINPSIGWSNNIVPNVVKDFALSFSKAILSSKTLTDMFNLKQIDAREIPRNFFKLVYAHLNSLGSSYPLLNADLAAQAIGMNSDRLPPYLLSYIYGFTTGIQLFREGKLTSENASDLSKKYATEVEKTVALFVPSAPETRLRVITRSFRNFMKSFGGYTADTLPLMIRYFVWAVNFLTYG